MPIKNDYIHIKNDDMPIKNDAIPIKLSFGAKKVLIRTLTQDPYNSLDNAYIKLH